MTKKLDQFPAPEGGEKGYYPDPMGIANTERMWDGMKWTPYTRPVQSPTPVVAAASTPTPAPKTSPAPPPSESSGFLRSAIDGFKKWPTWVQWTVGIFVVLMVIGGIGNLVDPEEKEKDKPAQTTAAETTSTEEGAASTDVAPPPPPSPKERINAVLQDQFGDQLDPKETNIIKRVDRGYTVIAVYHEDASGGFGTQKDAIKGEMVDAYRALFTDASLQVEEAVIDAEIPLIDKFGKESQGPGWETKLSRNIARKVQWENSDYLDWENIWDTVIKRPDLD